MQILGLDLFQLYSSRIASNVPFCFVPVVRGVPGVLFAWGREYYA